MVPVTRLAGSARAWATPGGRAAEPKAAPAASCRKALRSLRLLVMNTPDGPPRPLSDNSANCNADADKLETPNS